MKTVSRETIEEINTKKWSKQEKWFLIWSIEYANQRVPKQNPERTQIWEKTFYTMCPGKKNFKQKDKNNKKARILKEKIFTEKQLIEVKEQVKKAIITNTPMAELINAAQLLEETTENYEEDLNNNTLTHINAAPNHQEKPPEGDMNYSLNEGFDAVDTREINAFISQ